MCYKLLVGDVLRASEISLGTMSFSDTSGFGADEKDSHRFLASYVEAGSNFVNRAITYAAREQKRHSH